MTIKDEILDYIKRNDWVSFAELQRIHGFRDTDGPDCVILTFPGIPNIMFWSGMTMAAADALRALRPGPQRHQLRKPVGSSKGH